MRINSLATILLAFVALAMFGTIGCDKAEQATNGSQADHSHDGDHSHSDESHDDHPAHGPNHGHIFALDSDEYQGEWQKFSDSDVINMYILDANGQNIALKVDSFTVTPKVGNDNSSFTLEAKDADADGATAAYTLDDKDLSIAIPLGVDIEIKAHEPLDH